MSMPTVFYCIKYACLLLGLGGVLVCSGLLIQDGVKAVKGKVISSVLKVSGAIPALFSVGFFTMALYLALRLKFDI